MTDDAFLMRFEAAALSSFDHRDHLRVAFAYARRGGLDHAVARAREGLRRFATAHGEPGRYHATLTTAWARVVAHYALRARDADFDAFLAAHPRLLERDLLCDHYSRERLFSEAARAAFVEPDLLALP
jgi:N-formylglutamate deformylase